MIQAMRQPTETERREIVRTVFGEGLVYHANSPRFQTYFNHYCFVVCPASLGDAVIEFDTPVLQSHADVLNCVNIIIHNPQISFDEFVVKVFDAKSSGASLREKEHVARVAIEVAFAVNCTVGDYHSGNFISGTSHHVKWEHNVSFLSFIKDTFNRGPQSPQTPKEQHKYDEIMTRKTSLKAWKLTKRYGIKIRGTDNLLEHLILDTKSMTLKVFHQVSFLRAHLEKSKQEPLNIDFEESLRRQGAP